MLFFYNRQGTFCIISSFCVLLSTERLVGRQLNAIEWRKLSSVSNVCLLQIICLMCFANSQWYWFDFDQLHKTRETCVLEINKCKERVPVEFADPFCCFPPLLTHCSVALAQLLKRKQGPLVCLIHLHIWLHIWYSVSRICCRLGRGG